MALIANKTIIGVQPKQYLSGSPLQATVDGLDLPAVFLDQKVNIAAVCGLRSQDVTRPVGWQAVVDDVLEIRMRPRRD